MKLKSDAGQSMLTVAILFLGVLICAGLAVDAGIGLSARRQMQNAADAGALAGAHELCFGTRAQAIVTAQTYAIENGASSPVSVEFRDQHGNVDATDGYIVWVEASTQAETALLGVLGTDSYAVKASAAAACGVAATACGLWPLTFSEEVWNRNCGKVIYVWNAQNTQQEIDCDLVDCDLDNDGISDVITGAGRGWVDFSDSTNPLYPDQCTQTGCGAAEMSCLVANSSKDRVILPTCLPGVGGVRASVVTDAIARQGDRVKIPIFDALGCAAGRSCPNGETYHITRFGCAYVEPAIGANELAYYDSAKHELELHEILDPTKTLKSSVIRVQIDCGFCQTECGKTSGAAPPPGGGTVLAVSLVE